MGSMSSLHPRANAGSAIYTPILLRSIYDTWVLGISNTYFWKCPTASVLLPFFEMHMSRRHLDVGVGTGYFPSAALSVREQRCSEISSDLKHRPSTT